MIEQPINYMTFPGLEPRYKQVQVADDDALANAYIDLLSHITGIERDKLVNNNKIGSKKRKVVIPRQLFCYAIRQKTDMPLAKIAKHIGYVDHSCVIYSIKTFAKYYKKQNDPANKLYMEFLKYVDIK